METSSWQFSALGALALLSLLFAASCATEQQPAPAPAVAPPLLSAPAPPPPQSKANSSTAVKASFQGQEEAGKITASGERFNPNDLTAASKTLPIGSTAVVTNPKTGKSVKVRINDRGPFVRGRSLDLSKRAADQIGITDKGVARVQVKRVDSKPPRRESTNSPADAAPTPMP